MNYWTDERIELLVKLAGEHQSATEIAIGLGGISRNAVLGAANRRGIRINSYGADGLLRRIKARGKPRVAPVSPGNKTVRPKMVAAAAPKLRVVEVHSEPKTLLALGGHMCRWPVGDEPARPADQLFCAYSTAEGEVYCRRHKTLAWTPPKHVGAAYIHSLRRFA